MNGEDIMLTIQKMFIAYNITKRTEQPKYVVIHDTGNADKGANALMHYKYFNGANRNASADFFVDDSNIVQTVDYTKNYSWHCGDGKGKYGITNANSIGIEICINSDGNYAKAYQNAVELAAYLLKTLGLGMDRLVRHYDASRKMCPNSMSGNNWAKWTEFRTKVNALLAPAPVDNTPAIMGKGQVTADQAKLHLVSVNDKADTTIVDLYVKWGDSEGVRWDLAFAQALHETNYFRFGGDVKPEQNNFAGIGTTGGGVAGATFPDKSTGVLAQIQHLKAYASSAALVNKNVDPRYDLVSPHGKAPTLKGLTGAWATDTQYDVKIMAIYDKIKATVVPIHNWKFDGIDYLDSLGLLSDPDGWKSKIDEPMPVWAAMTIVANALKKVNK